MNKGFTTAEISSKPTEQKNRAFTLAEVLITIGIIGIVAAMTLPTVINNIQDKQFKAAFKKEFSAISQAMLKVYTDDETTYEQVEWQNMATYVCKVAKQLKTVKSGLKCDLILAQNESISDNISQMWDLKEISWYGGGNNKLQWYDKHGKIMTINTAFNAYTFALSDGTVINFNSVNQIFIDVNGFKKPNTIGRDIFYCYLPDGEVTPGFFKRDDADLSVNGFNCPDYCTKINKDNYEEDCKSGSGWGCSPMYILD